MFAFRVCSLRFSWFTLVGLRGRLLGCSAGVDGFSDLCVWVLFYGCTCCFWVCLCGVYLVIWLLILVLTFGVVALLAFGGLVFSVVFSLIWVVVWNLLIGWLIVMWTLGPVCDLGFGGLCFVAFCVLGLAFDCDWALLVCCLFCMGVWVCTHVCWGFCLDSLGLIVGVFVLVNGLTLYYVLTLAIDFEFHY